LDRHGLYDENAPRLALVIRYIGSIERQLNRTIAILERMQKERRDAAPSEIQPEQPQPAPKVMAAGAGIGSSFDYAAPAEFVSSNVRITPARRPESRETGADTAPALRKIGS
jgi:hypothetical protein